MTSQSILVTGGAGFIGSHLVERLLADGHSVVVIDDLSTGSLDNLRAVAAHPGLRAITGAVSSCQNLEEIAAQSAGIYHLAAAVGVELVMNEPVRAIETNLRETQAILNAASQAGTPFLLASTSEVYGKSQADGFTETDDLLIGPPHLSRWGYACSKLMDEFLALAHAKTHGLPVTVARLFNTVGPRQTGRYGMVLPRFIAAAKTGQPLRVFGDGSQTRCFCHVLDTVEALVRLRGNPAARGEIFNIGGDFEVTIGELARRVIQVLGSSSPIEMIPYPQAYPAGFEDMLRRKPVLDKLFKCSGFRPKYSLDEIIRDTATSMEFQTGTNGSQCK